jgi:Ca2+-binding EF-hand superfamily protein
VFSVLTIAGVLLKKLVRMSQIGRETFFDLERCRKFGRECRKVREEETFMLFDRGTGTIPIDDLGKVLRALGESPTNAILDDCLVELIAKTGKTRFSYADFRELILPKVISKYCTAFYSFSPF